MTTPGEPSAAQVIAQVDVDAGTRLRLLGRLQGGQQGGAWLVVDDAASRDDPLVLTWTTHPGLVARRPQTTRLVEALCERGYPTPRWRHRGISPDGVAWVVADRAPGSRARWETAPVDRILDTVELQRDVAATPGETEAQGASPGSPGTWNDYLHWALVAEDGPRRDVLPLGHEAAGLLAMVEGAAAEAASTRFPAADAVHGDLGLANVLVDHTAAGTPAVWVVDVGAVGPGTRAIDHAWLYRDAVAHAAPSRAVHRIGEAGASVAGERVWRCCVALACLEVVAFVGRTAGPRAASAELARLRPLVRRPGGA